jgi:isopentenyldiphosphate isomerase/intracellular septation protein A
LIKKLIPGLIPLLVFIVADEIWGMKVGLVVAVSIGLVEMLITWIREKRIDNFVLLDMFLLFVLSSLSYLFENEIFFKVKPAMMDLVLVALLSLSLFSRIDPLGSMSQRYLKDVKLEGIQKDLFRKNLFVMLWITLIHTLMVLWAAFFMSKEVWAFVSSFMLFIMMGAYLLFMVIRQRMKGRMDPVISDAEEWLPVVDEEGRILGKALRSYCHNGSRTLHPVVHLHLLNSDSSLYLQKRSMTKLVQPGKWDTAVGGHLAYGESIEESLMREAMEEIGLQDFKAVPAIKYRWDSDIESELVYSFIAYNGKPDALSSVEISEGKFWKVKEIERNLGKGIFTPNFEHEFGMLKKSGLLSSRH